MDRSESSQQQQQSISGKQEQQVKSEVLPCANETPQDQGWEAEGKFVEVKLRQPPADEVPIEPSEPTDILKGTE